MKTMLIILLVLACFAASAQIPQPDPDTTVRHFLIVASIDNLQEINAGKLASAKATNGEVRSFGQMMEKDHGQAEQQLLQLAKSKNIELPDAATSGIQPDLDLKKAGSDFDHLYVHAMVSGHSGAVRMFETYATNGKDPAVKAFAKQLLPRLKAHLAAIKAIDEKLNYH